MSSISVSSFLFHFQTCKEFQKYSLSISNNMTQNDIQSHLKPLLVNGESLFEWKQIADCIQHEKWHWPLWALSPIDNPLDSMETTVPVILCNNVVSTICLFHLIKHTGGFIFHNSVIFLWFFWQHLTFSRISHYQNTYRTIFSQNYAKVILKWIRSIEIWYLNQLS